MKKKINNCPLTEDLQLGSFLLAPSYYPYEKHPENLDDENVVDFLRSIRDEVVDDESNNIFAGACSFFTGGIFSPGSITPQDTGTGAPCLVTLDPTDPDGPGLVYNWSVPITDPLPKTALPPTTSENFVAIYNTDYPNLPTNPAICEAFKSRVDLTLIPEVLDIRCYETVVYEAPSGGFGCPGQGVQGIIVSVDYNPEEILPDQVYLTVQYLQGESDFGSIPVPSVGGEICQRTDAPLDLNTFENLESCKTSSSYLFNQKMMNKNSKENKSILKKGKKQLQTCTNNQMKDNLNYNRLSKKEKKSISKSEFKSYKSVTKNLSKNKN